MSLKKKKTITNLYFQISKLNTYIFLKLHAFRFSSEILNQAFNILLQNMSKK